MDFQEKAKYQVVLTGRQIEILDYLLAINNERIEKEHRYDPEVRRQELGFMKRIKGAFITSKLRKEGKT